MMIVKIGETLLMMETQNIGMIYTVDLMMMK